MCLHTKDERTTGEEEEGDEEGNRRDAFNTAQEGRELKEAKLRSGPVTRASITPEIWAQAFLTRCLI